MEILKWNAKHLTYAVGEMTETFTSSGEQVDGSILIQFELWSREI